MQKTFADRYHTFEKEHWWFRARRHILRDRLQALSWPSHPRILEVGTGPGENLYSLYPDDALLPGVEPDELKVVINDGTLVVAGNRPMPGHPGRMMLRRLEIPHGHFERQLQLPAGRYEIGQRELKNGCLVLSLRKLP